MLLNIHLTKGHVTRKHALSEFVSFGVKSLISNGTGVVEQSVIFSLLLFICFANFRHSHWSRTQNVNKRAEWLTLFALVVCSIFKENLLRIRKRLFILL